MYNSTEPCTLESNMHGYLSQQHLVLDGIIMPWVSDCDWYLRESCIILHIRGSQTFPYEGPSQLIHIRPQTPSLKIKKKSFNQ